ncbi:MAG: hypothetical protein IKT17_03245, partial [Lachnospiraceae bacterium]|nr:hypothetical protein [Lachnospiraceae bacterium]
MKLLKRIVIFFTLFMLAALMIFYNINKRNQYRKRDIVGYNDMLYLICDDYAAGLSKEEIEAKYGCVIVLSTRLDDPELSALYADNAFVLDLAPDGEYIGKVAWTDVKGEYERSKDEFLHAALVLW